MADDDEEEPKAVRPPRLSLSDRVRLMRRLEHRVAHQKSLSPEMRERERERLTTKRMRMQIKRYGPG